MQEKEQEYPKVDNDYTPMKQILWGIFFTGCGIFIYYYLNNFEQSGDSIRLPAILMIIYKLMGKYVSAGIFILFGLFFVYSGISDFIKGKKQ